MPTQPCWPTKGERYDACVIALIPCVAVPLSVQLGVVCAVLTALGSIVGFFLKHKGALNAPLVDWRRPLHSTIELFKSPIYTLGCVVATTSWGFHVAALALAPISLVQSVIAGGLVLITVVADRFFGHSVTRREWIGVALTAAGLAFLAATLEGTADEAHSDYLPWVFGMVLLVTTAASIALVVRGTSNGPALAIAAGLLWAGSDITIKALTGHSSATLSGVLFAAIIVVWSLVALLISAKSLQLGPVVPVIALTSATANVITIAAGPVIFQEPLPEEPGALLIRLAAFALVITAAAMTPPPGSVVKREATA
jgi:drug/metabolite transporter (DMT)-like permease